MTCVITYQQDPFIIPGQGYVQERSHDCHILSAKLSLYNIDA